LVNGGLNPQPLTESGVAAPAGFFWSEVQHDTGNTTVANANAGYSVNQGAFRLADNFTLTQNCTINNLVFYGYLTGAPATPSPFTAYTLQIWNGRPGDPGAAVVFGDTTTNRLASSVDTTFFRIFNTVVPPPGIAQGTTRKIWRNTVNVGGLALAAGTYWVDWASTVSTNAAHFAPSKTIAGARSAAGDNARQLTVSTGVWADVTDIGLPAQPTGVPQDFPFEVNGLPTGGTPTPSPTVTPPITTPTPTPTVTPPITTPTPTPTVTPPTTTPTPSPTVTPPTTTPTPSATPTVAPSATPTASPSATPLVTQAINLSTRMRVQIGDKVGIGGFIITGSAAKQVLLRAIGPSLTHYDVPDVLADPVLELHGPGGFVTMTNDNWRQTQEAAIQATGIPPTDDLESAILATLTPGSYTAIVKGKNNTSGVGLIEVYDLNQSAASKLSNLSTRAFVSTGSDIVIAGFLLSDNNTLDRMVVRGIGPSLAPGSFPANAVLADPTLELRDANGSLLIANNDWQDNPAQAAAITAAGLAPSNILESGIAATLPPGLYTALLAGLNGGTGIGLVEVYDLGP
jgi:hypothetical protein